MDIATGILMALCSAKYIDTAATVAEISIAAPCAANCVRSAGIAARIDSSPPASLTKAELLFLAMPTYRPLTSRDAWLLETARFPAGWYRVRPTTPASLAILITIAAIIVNSPPADAATKEEAPAFLRVTPPTIAVSAGLSGHF
jgi:hypothetical protein